LRTSNSGLHVVAVNGCCYGTDSRPDKGDHFKYCGQDFWAFLSDDENLYVDIVEPLGHRAKERNEAYMESYSKMVNKFVREFTIDFCDSEGSINWDKLVKYNSGSRNVSP